MKITGQNDSAAQLKSLLQMQQSQTEKLATAKRINTAADDAAGLQVTERLTSAVNGAVQGQRNLYDGIGLAQVYEQSLQNISKDLAGLSQLAIAAGNGIYTDADRAALQQQASGYLKNIENTLQNSSFAGKPLFVAQASVDGAVAFNTGQSNVTLNISDVAAELDGQSLFAISVNSQSAAQAATNTLAEVAEFVVALQAEAGASINSFAAQARSLNNQQITEAEGRSRIEDLDYAKALSEKTATDILSQSSTSVAMQARMQQQAALDLL